MTEEEFNEIAWRDFIMFAVGNDDIVAQFNAETGRSYGQTLAPIDAMIDEATGKLDSDTEAFVLWVTENHWGADCAPEKVRAAIEARSNTEEVDVWDAKEVSSHHE